MGDADTKLIPCWHVASRDAVSARIFIADLASRLKNRVQLTTDGRGAYVRAVENAFGADVDFAQLVKIYGLPEGNSQERRYSAGECCGAVKTAICGNPDEKALTCFAASQSSLDGKLLAKLLQQMARSAKSSATHKRHLRLLASIARDVQATTAKVIAEARQLGEQEILDAAQRDGENG